MTDLPVRRSEMKPSLLEHEWDPFRWMREMMRWDPLATSRPTMMSQRDLYFPEFDVKDNREGLLLKADLPGVKESDVEVTLTGNRLTIGGKREAEKEEKGETYYACERSYGAFTRTFTLPTDVDAAKIHAELKNGVLTVLLPHSPGAQPKKIAVKST